MAMSVDRKEAAKEVSHPCYVCEKGVVRPRSILGRKFSYRDEPELVLDIDLTVATCDSCGELYLGTGQTGKLSDALERLRLARKRRTVEDFAALIATEYPLVPKAEWEQFLGISPGYLSRLASGQRVAESPLEILLEQLISDTKGALRLSARTRPLPSGLAGLIGASKARV